MHPNGLQQISLSQYQVAKITFYGRHSYFTARCEQPGHFRCVLTRSSEEGRRPAQGRPLGLLTSWLHVGVGLASKEEHWAADHWPTLAQRQEHRELLATYAGGAELLNLERDRRAGEGEEPDLAP